MNRGYFFFAAPATLLAASFNVVAHADDSLEAVVVTAARIEQPVSDVIGSVTVITRAQIEQRQIQSVQDLLRGEAGIDVTNTGGLGKLSSVFMRGANSNQTLILVDGVRMGSATAGTTRIEFIPIDQIERVEIVRGPRSSLYGSDAIGGVIQIFTRKNSGVNASASYGTYNTQGYSAGFGMHQAALRFSVQGSHQQSDGFNSCAGSTSGGCFTVEPDDDGYHSNNASARVGYNFGKADLELSTLYAKGYSEYDSGFANQTRYINSAPSARLQVQANDALSFTVQGGITEDKNTDYKNNVFASRFNTEKRNAGVQADWAVMKDHTITLGADYLQDRVDSDTQFTAISRNNKGVYAQYLGKLSAHELSASVRRDDNEQFGSHNTGNLGWKWFALDKTLALNVGAGTAFHAPTFNDLYYPYGYGNPLLKPERSSSVELGLSGQVNAIHWSWQNYQTRAHDLIVLDSNFVPANLSEARLRGSELTFDTRLDAFSAALTYTWLDARNLQSGSNYNHYLPRRARQSGRLELGYDFGQAQIGAVLNVAGERFDNVANTQPLPGYATVDFKADMKLAKHFGLQIKVANFFDRDYQTVRFYNQAGRTLMVTLRYIQ